jgi:tRNA pseudouridine38-40 synthase
LAYDGGAFRGFAEQQAVPTVAGTLVAALARVTRCDPPPVLVCAGRTDAGVHARGQVVHADLPSPLPAVRRRGNEQVMAARDLVEALNRQLAPRIVVREAAPAPAGFDARRSAVARRYRYLIWSCPRPDPLLAPLAWHVPADLDLRAMAGASDALIGSHDFRAFCRRAPGTSADQPIVRRVRRAEWRELAGPVPGGRLLRFDVEADSFCHQMVRSLVAVVVEVGRGREDTAGVVRRLRSGVRTGAPRPAPPEGLCLVGVRYPGESPFAALAGG